MGYFMKFAICRSSGWNESKPCEEAFWEVCIRVDERACDNPRKIPAQSHMTQEEADAWWLSEGSNHRIENGFIRRDFPHEDWFVEINNLEELLEFQKKYGSIILSHDPTPSIEIYDDYRE